MATRYTLRLDELAGTDTNECLKRFLAEYDGEFTAYVFAYEKAAKTGKMHYQGWVEVDWRKSKWYAAVTKCFPHTGSSRACPVMREEAYLSYVLKDDDVRFKKGVTDEQLAEWKSKSYHVEDGGEGCSRKKEPKPKEVSGFQRLRDHCLKWHHDHPAEEWNGWVIAKLIIKWYLVQVKCEPNDFQIRSQAKSIWHYWMSLQSETAYDNYLTQRARSIIGCEWVH